MTRLSMPPALSSIALTRREVVAHVSPDELLACPGLIQLLPKFYLRELQDRNVGLSLLHCISWRDSLRYAD